MTTFDQFEIDLAASLSGSMTSNVFVGSALTSSIVTSSTIYNTNRVLFGDKWGGVYSASLTNQVVSKWRYSDWHSYRYNRVIAGSNRFMICQETGKFYLDSIMPDIVSIAAQNSDYIYSSSTYKGDADLQAPGFPLNQAATVVVRKTSPWFQAFPFQTQYKNLGRQLQQGRLLTISTGSAVSLGGISFEDANNDIFTIQDISSSNPSVEFENPGAYFEDQSPVLMVLPIELTRKTFFCFGDGLEPRGNPFGTSASARYRQLPLYTIRHFPDPYFLAGPIFRGFRYGALNANPVTPNFIYSRTHFGQMRDLIEAPPYSAFLQDATQTYAVDITFISSSSAYASASLYASASSPTTFNLYDSGIYDIRARSGQPFSDRSGD